MPPDNDPLARIERQLERLEDRTRDLATRSDLADLRKEVVINAVLESQLTVFKTQITTLEKRIEEMEREQISRSERLWARLGPAVGALAFLLALFEFLSHLKFT